jgi:hypothetical protein
MRDIKKRLAHIKAALFRRHLPFETGRDTSEVASSNEFGTTSVARGTAALKRAKEYFGSDSDYMVTLAMAEVLFGRQERGRAKGTKIWTELKYMELAQACADLHAKNPKLKDAEIARLLTKTATYSHYPPETLRQQIVAAKRLVRACL